MASDQGAHPWKGHLEVPHADDEPGRVQTPSSSCSNVTVWRRLSILKITMEGNRK